MRSLRALPLVLSALYAIGTWAMPARADCSSQGSHCTPSEVIAEQTAREGRIQREEARKKEREVALKAAASSGSRPAPSAPPCVRISSVNAHCAALVQLARNRWRMPGNGSAEVAAYLGAGHEPRCESGNLSKWTGTCKLSAEDWQSLSGTKPSVVARPAEPRKDAAAERAEVARRNRLTVNERADEDWQARFEKGQKLATSSEDLTRLRIERIRCMWGNEHACEVCARRSQRDDVVWALIRKCELNSFGTCGPLATRIPRLDHTLKREATEVDCDRGSGDACALVAEWHLDPSTQPAWKRPVEAEPAFGRSLARRTCEKGSVAACQKLVGAITRGLGGAAKPDDDEARALGKACEKAKPEELEPAVREQLCAGRDHEAGP